MFVVCPKVEYTIRNRICGPSVISVGASRWLSANGGGEVGVLGVGIVAGRGVYGGGGGIFSSRMIMMGGRRVRV